MRPDHDILGWNARALLRAAYFSILYRVRYSPLFVLRNMCISLYIGSKTCRSITSSTLPVKLLRISRSRGKIIANSYRALSTPRLILRIMVKAVYIEIKTEYSIACGLRAIKAARTFRSVRKSEREFSF